MRRIVRNLLHPCVKRKDIAAFEQIAHHLHDTLDREICNSRRYLHDAFDLPFTNQESLVQSSSSSERFLSSSLASSGDLDSSYQDLIACEQATSEEHFNKSSWIIFANYAVPLNIFCIRKVHKS